MDVISTKLTGQQWVLQWHWVRLISLCQCKPLYTTVNQLLGFGLMMFFFIWTGDEKFLKHFLNFCYNYSKSKGMESTIKFTYSYSTLTVNFLDVTVKEEKMRHFQQLFLLNPQLPIITCMPNLVILFTQWKHYQSHNLLEFAGFALSHRTIGMMQIYS